MIEITNYKLARNLAIINLSRHFFQKGMNGAPKKSLTLTFPGVIRISSLWFVVLDGIVRTFQYRLSIKIKKCRETYLGKAMAVIQSDRAGGDIKVTAKTDLYPDYQTNILTVRFYSLATSGDNLAIREICQIKI